MKYSFLLLFLFLSVFLNAQKKEVIWYSFEPKVGIASSILLNKNISDDKTIKPEYLNTYPVFGAGLGVYFKKIVCTQIELLSTKYGQSYNYESIESAKNNVRINSTDLVSVARGISDGMGYSGFGIKQSFISKVVDDSLGDKTNKFKKHFLSIVLDLGFILYHNNVFDMNMNLRFGYALSDAGKSESNQFYQPGQYSSAIYDSYKPTNPASVQLTLNFNWHVGYFATSQCKQKKGFIFFSN